MKMKTTTTETTTTATTVTAETSAFYTALDTVVTAASKAVSMGNADRIDDGDGDIITLHGEGRVVILEEGEGVEVRFTHPTFTARRPSKADKFHVMEQSAVFRPLASFERFSKLEGKEIVFSVGAEYNDFLLEAEQEKQAVAPTSKKSTETKPVDETETTETAGFVAVSLAKELFTVVDNSTQAGEYAVKLGALDPETFSAVTVNLVNLYQVSGTPENRPEKVTKGIPFVYQAVKNGEKNLVRRLLTEMQATANKDAVKAMAMMYYEFTSLSWLNGDHKDVTVRRVKGHHRLGDVWPEIEGVIDTLATKAISTKKAWLTVNAYAAEGNLEAGKNAVSEAGLSKREFKELSYRLYSTIGINAAMTIQVWRMIIDGTTTVNNAKTTELATIKYKSVGDVKHDVERGVMLCALGRAVEYK